MPVIFNLIPVIIFTQCCKVQTLSPTLSAQNLPEHKVLVTAILLQVFRNGPNMKRTEVQLCAVQDFLAMGYRHMNNLRHLLSKFLLSV
jgi:hypothetical protein